MTAYDFRVGATTGPLALEYRDEHLTPQFQLTAAYNNAGAGIASGDTFKLLTIPAGTWLWLVSWNVVTAEGSTLTFSLGDSSSGTVISSSGVNGNSAGRSSVSPLNRFYTADDYILLTANNAATKAVVQFWFTLIDHSLIRPATGYNQGGKIALTQGQG